MRRHGDTREPDRAGTAGGGTRGTGRPLPLILATILARNQMHVAGSIIIVAAR